jgi:uncharacterized protein (TIGR02996 family)
MDRAAAFLGAIRDEPDDDTPRLIFADWLEEHGGAAERARAAFVRAQCALARLPADDPGRPALEDEARSLLAAHEAEWAAPLAGVAADWEFRRGFVEWVRVSAGDLLAHAERLFDSAPLRAAHVRLGDGQAPALAACPYLARLEALDLSDCHLRDRAVQEILASPHLAGVSELDLAGNGVEGPAVRALAESEVLHRLRRLDFSRNHGFGDRAARTLASAARAGGLRWLGLADTNLTAHGVQDVFRSPALRGLTGLTVARSHAPWPRDLNAVLDGPGAGPLPDRLEALDLSGHRLNVPAARRLGSPNLRRLVLRRCGLGDAGVQALAESPELAGLTALDVGVNRVGPAGLEALAASPHMANLTELRAGGNTARDAGAKALASSPHLTGLTVLDLSNNGLGGPGVRTVAESPNLAGLRALSLASNYVGPPGLRALGASPVLARLRSLDLGGIRLDADGARLLAEGPMLGRLAELFLPGNRLGDAGAAALAASPHLRHLTTLDLSDNGIGPAGVEALTKSSYLACGLRLGLAKNDLGDREWHQLAARFGRHVTR